MGGRGKGFKVKERGVWGEGVGLEWNECNVDGWRKKMPLSIL